MNVRFRAAARSELGEAIDCYARIQPQLGERLAYAVAEAIADIQDYPNASPMVEAG